MLWELIPADELCEDDATACESVLLTVEADDTRWVGAAIVGMQVATGFAKTNAGAGAGAAADTGVGASAGAGVVDFVAIGVWRSSEGGGFDMAGEGIDNADSGSRLFFSLIEMTIFSRSMGVMWFCWRPRVRCSDDSLLLNSGLRIGEGCNDDTSSSSDRSSVDETLLERAGRGMLFRGRGMREHTNVSRFHRRQLRFSNRLPSSMASEILLKTAEYQQQSIG
jgi:hypothetical protein